VNQDCEKYMDFYLKFSEVINFAFVNKCIKSNQMRCVTTQEAETIKYFRNCFLATKIGFCNEFYRFCNARGISYDKVSEIACLDNRITSYHSKVPGPDGKTGFSGHCLPKDLNSMIYQMYQSEVKPIVLQSVKIRNEDIDRADKDWENDKGRAVIN
jgi:UDP-glucose 6-dehydrogenase